MTEHELLEKILLKIENIEEGQKSFDARLEKIETRTQRLEVLLENELPKQVRLIAEQHGDIIAKLDRLSDYPDTKSRVATLETVVKSHSKDIQSLQKAVG